MLEENGNVATPRLEATARFPYPAPVTVSDAPTSRTESVDCYQCRSPVFEPLLASCDRIHRVPGEYRIVRCADCGLVRQHPRITREAIDDHFPPNYPMNQYRNAPPGASLRQRIVGRQLARMNRLKVRRVLASGPLDGGSSLLDIGCGNGTFLAAIGRATGCRTVGVEPSPESRRLAVEEHGLDVRAGMFQEADLEGETFDVITLWHVLEHFWDPRPSLESLRRYLAPGGRLVIEVPDFSDPMARFFGRFWCNLELPRHLTHFTPDTLRRMLESAGYQVPFLHRGGAMPPYSVTVASTFAALGATYDPDLVGTAYAGWVVWHLTWPLFALEGLVTGRGVMSAVARPA